MKKIVCLLAVMMGVSAFSQEFHRCYTRELMLQQEERTPGYLNLVDELFERAKLVDGQDREELYTIPVVVHIVYNTDAENLADSVVFNQIESLNADFRRLNEDADETRDEFSTIVGDTFIGFELASVDPDGNPTNGITRTNTDVESFIDFATFSAEGVKSSAEGGIDPWDQERYMNIWVCDMSVFGEVFLLGYATPPLGLPHWPDDAGLEDLSDGVVVQFEAFGSNNPNPLDAGGGEIDVRGRTTTHEVGHYLGLRHIWGDGDCSEEDGVDDTPNAAAQSEQDCDHDKNTCVDDIADLGDLPDMVENYMDYSAETCQNAFTNGQSEIMRGVLEVERFDLVNDNPALGIETENLTGINYQIYPNPSQGEVQIKFNNDESLVANVRVFSETGVLVHELNMNSQSEMASIGDLAKGFYLVRVETAKGAKTEKLIVY